MLHLTAADKVSGSGVLDEADGVSIHKMDGLKLRAPSRGRVIRTLLPSTPQITQQEFLPKVAIRGDSGLQKTNPGLLDKQMTACIAC